MANRPRDLFNLLKAVRHPLAKSFYGYAKRYCAAYDNGFGPRRPTAPRTSTSWPTIVSGVMLRRTKSEALDLPEKVRSWVPVDVPDHPGPRRRAARPRLPRRAPGPLRARRGSRSSACSTGPATPSPSPRRRRPPTSSPTASRPARRSSCSRRTPPSSTRCASGSATPASPSPATTAPAARDARRRSASRPTRRSACSSATSQAAGVGITLTAGTHVVFNDLDWVPANHWQAEDRIHRIGQTETTFATYLHAAGTLDDYVAALLEQKAATIATLEDAARDNASLVDAVVGRGARRPSRRRRRTATPPRRHARRWDCSSETLDLLARFNERAARRPTSARTSSSSPAPASRASCTTCASPTASPCATAPGSPTRATASTAAR